MIVALESSNQDFSRILRDAAKRGVTAAELHAQRVSFIVSSISDEKTTVTADDVESELRRLSGIKG